MIATVERWSGTPPADWDETVSRLGGTVFQSSVWADYQRKSQNVEPVFLLARDGAGRAAGVALAVFRRSPWPIASLIFRTMRLTAHPVVADVADAEGFMRRIEAIARALGCSRLTLESFMSADSGFVPASHGYAESLRVEFLVDLTRPLDELWSAIGKDQRDKIKRLARENVSIEEGGTRDDLQGLGMARQATQAKRAARGQGYESNAGAGYYADIFDYLMARGAGRLFVAREAGEVVAGLFFSTYNGRAYSVLSGATERGYRLGAQPGIYWAAVETLRGEGYALLNRGGVPAAAEVEGHPQHGIYAFKKRLGATPCLCRSGEIVLSPTRERLSGWRARLRGLMATA